MDKWIFLGDVVNIVLSLLAIVISAKLVWRTESTLDRASKAFLATSIVLFAISLVMANRYFLIIPERYTLFFFQISRPIIFTLFVLGLVLLLEMVSKESKK